MTKYSHIKMFQLLVAAFLLFTPHWCLQFCHLHFYQKLFTHLYYTLQGNWKLEDPPAGPSPQRTSGPGMAAAVGREIQLSASS